MVEGLDRLQKVLVIGSGPIWCATFSNESNRFRSYCYRASGGI